MQKIKYLAVALVAAGLLTGCGLSKEAQAFYDSCVPAVKALTLGAMEESKIEEACQKVAETYDDADKDSSALLNEVKKELGL